MTFAVMLVAVLGSAWAGRAIYKRQAAETELARQQQLAARDPAELAPRRTVYTEKILPAHTTFSEFIENAGLAAPTADRLIREARGVYDLSRVRAGHELTIARSGLGEFRALGYQIAPDRLLWVKQEGEDFHAEIQAVPYVVTVAGVSGQVQDSLIESVENIGERDQLALRIADIFGWDIDFNTDTRPGDSFEVVVEKKLLNGEFQGYGRVLAAEYLNGRRLRQAVLFHDPEGHPAYYAPSGKSMKKAFLRSPLRFAARVTSGFSYHRFHPILKMYRPHLGIDYAAPVGSAVQAVADGTVAAAGWQGGGGKEIRLRHARGYETYYLHLSRILVRPGQRVRQGQLIGETGSTGLATGPHLDFRVAERGRFRNFLALHLPPAQSVAAQDWNEFEKTRSAMLDQMAGLRTYPAEASQPAPLDNPQPASEKEK